VNDAAHLTQKWLNVSELVCAELKATNAALEIKISTLMKESAEHQESVEKLTERNLVLKREIEMMKEELWVAQATRIDQGQNLGEKEDLDEARARLDGANASEYFGNRWIDMISKANPFRVRRPPL
jgi:hypothetical protein